MKESNTRELATMILQGNIENPQFRGLSRSQEAEIEREIVNYLSSERRVMRLFGENNPYLNVSQAQIIRDNF